MREIAPVRPAPPVADALTLRCYLDTPAEGATCSAIGFLCRGWAFTESTVPIQNVRLVDGDLVVEGHYGLPRPGARAALATAPDDLVGWELHAVLRPGAHEFAIEFQNETGEWLPGLRRRIRVARSWRPRWVPGYNTASLLPRQMPLHAQHPPQPLQPENFPPAPKPPLPLPRLSIVTPSLNQGWAIGTCIDAVTTARVGGPEFAPRNQSGALHARPTVPLDIEYCVQDGGSSDRTPDLLERRNTAIDEWESAPDAGQTDALVRGFAKTSGRPTDLMAWINADDFYLPGALRFVAEYFAKYPNIDVLYAHRLLVDRDGREVGRWFLPPHDPAVMRLHDLVPQETLFWRRRVWERVGGLRREFRFAMDRDLFLRFEATGAQIVRVPYFLAAFRLHSHRKARSMLATLGRDEIGRLHERTFGRRVAPEELENSRMLERYLRRSAWIEQLWKLGYRAA